MTSCEQEREIAELKEKIAAIGLEIARSEERGAALGAEFFSSKRKRDESEDEAYPQWIPRMRFRLDEADENPPVRQLCNESMKLVNAFLPTRLVFGAMEKVGLTPERMETEITITFKSSTLAWNQYRHGWTSLDQIHTIFINSFFLTRYVVVFLSLKSYSLQRQKFISYDRYGTIWDKEASIPERRRIEMIVAWKIIHQLAELGFAWANNGASPSALCPRAAAEGFTIMPGEITEQEMLGGLAGVVFDGGSDQWDGSQQVLGDDSANQIT